MSYEATIYCDHCSTIIAAARTASRARDENRQAGGVSRAPLDLCLDCVARGVTLQDTAASQNHDPAP